MCHNKNYIQSTEIHRARTFMNLHIFLVSIIVYLINIKNNSQCLLLNDKYSTNLVHISTINIFHIWIYFCLLKVYFESLLKIKHFGRYFCKSMSTIILNLS